jgi:hypothetical protein
MRVHAKGLLVLAVFVVVFAIGVDWRWGIAGIIAVAVVDFLSLAVPSPGRRAIAARGGK